MMWRNCTSCQVYWNENNVKCWCCGAETPISRGPGITANKYVENGAPIDPEDARYPAIGPRVLA